MRDAALLDEAFGRTAAWARRRGFAATAPGDELLVSTPQGLWRMRRSRCGDIRGGRRWPRRHGRPCAGHRRMAGPSPAMTDADRRVDAVVCSRAARSGVGAWLAAAARYADCAVPRLPHRRRPRCLATAPSIRCAGSHGLPARHAARQRLRSGTRHRCAACPRARSLVTASVPSDWHIPRTALRMQRALIDGTADAARRAQPSHADAITAWQEARLRQALRGRLAITIGHRDILALPPGG